MCRHEEGTTATAEFGLSRGSQQPMDPWFRSVSKFRAARLVMPHHRHCLLAAYGHFLSPEEHYCVRVLCDTASYPQHLHSAVAMGISACKTDEVSNNHHHAIITCAYYCGGLLAPERHSHQHMGMTELRRAGLEGWSARDLVHDETFPRASFRRRSTKLAACSFTHHHHLPEQHTSWVKSCCRVDCRLIVSTV
jgi:hypothetical protein